MANIVTTVDSKFDMSTLPEKVGKFSFKVPDTHPEAGKKIEKPFSYYEINKGDSDTAFKVIAAKGWDIVDMVNETMKANARSNAYQNASAPYRAAEVPAEDIQKRMINDYVRMGMSEEMARATVVNTLKALADGKLSGTGEAE